MYISEREIKALEESKSEVVELKSQSSELEGLSWLYDTGWYVWPSPSQNEKVAMKEVLQLTKKLLADAKQLICISG